MKLKLPYIFALASLLCVNSLSAQETKKDEKKIQEVVNLDADPPPVASLPDGSVAPADTGAPKPLVQSEIIKRAVNYIKIETKKYTKKNGVNSGSKAECVVSFNYKPKELNPQAEVEGTFSMHVSIEAKEGKYRYTISKMSHNANKADYSGGDLNSEVPACGSMKVSPELWKKMRGESLKHVAVVVADIKDAMLRSSRLPVESSEEW